MTSEEVIAALKLADRGGGHRDYADILAEAVRELAWVSNQMYCSTGDDDNEPGRYYRAVQVGRAVLGLEYSNAPTYAESVKDME